MLLCNNSVVSIQNGATAIHAACKGGHRSVVKMLQAHGASLDTMLEVDQLTSIAGIDSYIYTALISG